MIDFVTYNVDGRLCCWQYDSKEDLYNEWIDDDGEFVLPSNDDPLLYVAIDYKKVPLADDAIFLDLLVLLGLEERKQD